jgi:hypothetical protein
MHGRGYVQGQLACTKATDRSRARPLERAATHGLEGEPRWEKVVALPRVPKAGIEGAHLKAPTVSGPSPKARRPRHCNHARSRPCARPTSPHKGGRPKGGGPPWRGPPRVMRGGPSGRLLRAGVDRRRRGPCPDESESGVGHLVTLATPPVLSGTRLQRVGRGSGSESEGDG